MESHNPAMFQSPPTRSQYPLVNIQKAMEIGPFTVDPPIPDAIIFHSYVSLMALAIEIVDLPCFTMDLPIKTWWIYPLKMVDLM